MHNNRVDAPRAVHACGVETDPGAGVRTCGNPFVEKQA